MSLALTGGIALGYAVGVVGIHRYSVFRRRAAANGFKTLHWLDWETLLSGLNPAEGAPAPVAIAPREGGPPPLLRMRPGEAGRRQSELLHGVVGGQGAEASALEAAGFSGGEARWLAALSRLRSAPDAVLEELEGATASSVAEAYLREVLLLERRVNPLNLELAVFSAKRRIAGELKRFGDHAALYFVRARASALLGSGESVLDDLARAVYFSRESAFYLNAVLELPWVEEARPALTRACRVVLSRRRESGSNAVPADA